jgi:hypothetical protein
MMEVAESPRAGSGRSCPINPKANLVSVLMTELRFLRFVADDVQPMPIRHRLFDLAQRASSNPLSRFAGSPINT